MQQRHEEQQQSLLQLQEAVEACRAEHVAQKARRKAEAKAKEEAERQRVVKKKKKKYLQRLRDKILEEEAALLERAEGSQVVGPSVRRSLLETRRGNGPLRRLGGSTAEVLQSRWGALTPVRSVCALGRIAWCTSQGK